MTFRSRIHCMRGPLLALGVTSGSLSAPLAWADDPLQTGRFVGLNSHATSGQVTVERTDAGYEVVLGDDFSFDGAPDPKIALGRDGEVDVATLMGALASHSGSQRFTIPDGIDPASYNEIHLWCEQYSVGLGVAPLQ